MYGGPGKTKMRNFVIESAKQLFSRNGRESAKSALLLPSTGMLDVKQGLAEGIFNYKTQFYWAENNREYAQTLKFRSRYLKDREGRPLKYEPKIFVGDVYKMDLSQITRALDFAHIDTCNIVSSELLDFFIEVIGNSIAESITWMTVCRRHGKGCMFSKEDFENNNDINLITHEIRERLRRTDWGSRFKDTEIFFEEYPYRDSSNMLLIGAQYIPTGVLKRV